MKETEFVMIVEGVCKNPKFYTMNGTFEEVISFIEGWAMGTDVGESSLSSRTIPFRSWLTASIPFEQLPIRLKSMYENSADSDLKAYRKNNFSIMNWNEFSEMFPDNLSRIESLATFYRQYVEVKFNNLLPNDKNLETN